MPTQRTKRTSAQPLHWALLGVHRGAEKEALDAARRRLARDNHPDFGGTQDVMAAINVAYDTLVSATKEKRYVAELRSTHTDCATCRGNGGQWAQRGFKYRTFKPCAACNGCGLVEKVK